MVSVWLLSMQQPLYLSISAGVSQTERTTLDLLHSSLLPFRLPVIWSTQWPIQNGCPSLEGCYVALEMGLEQQWQVYIQHFLSSLYNWKVVQIKLTIRILISLSFLQNRRDVKSLSSNRIKQLLFQNGVIRRGIYLHCLLHTNHIPRSLFSRDRIMVYQPTECCCSIFGSCQRDHVGVMLHQSIECYTCKGRNW